MLLGLAFPIGAIITSSIGLAIHSRWSLDEHNATSEGWRVLLCSMGGWSLLLCLGQAWT